MTAQYDGIGGSGLQFFGKVAASISHELKNVLAIINENAGLLEDLTFAARRGAAIDPDKLERTVGNFTKQIHRADDILKNMNRFAHSVDKFECRVDLHELVALVANLAARKAAMGRITLETPVPAQPIQFDGNPFLLENLVWLCLELAIAATGAGRTLTLIPEKSASGILLHIGGIDTFSEAPEPNATALAEVCAALGAQMTTDPAGHRLTLHIG